MSQEEGPGSVSRIQCVARVIGKGECKVSLYRHMAPMTVNAIMHSLPAESRVNVQPAMVSLFTALRVGVEKARGSFERGDIGFLASNGLLCVFLKAVKSDRPLNPVGKVDGDIAVFEGVRPGDVVRISLERTEQAQSS